MITKENLIDIMLRTFQKMDVALKYDCALGRVYFSTEKLYNVIGFEYHLNAKGKVKEAYRFKRKLNQRNATNILLTISNCTSAYFDFKDGCFHCKCWRSHWNYREEILRNLKEEAEKDILFIICNLYYRKMVEK